MDIVNTLPAFARPTLERLAHHEQVGELKPRELDDNGDKQLQTVAWVVDRYQGYDENPAIDQAMGEVGKVVTGSTTLHFEGEMASLLGADKQGRPVAILMKKDAEAIEAYSVQNLGELLYVQGGRVELATHQGFYLAGAVSSGDNPANS